MFWSRAGAMSSAQLGITLAPAIREGLVHGLSVTGANLEVTDTSIPEHEAFRAVEKYIVPMGTRAGEHAERRFRHEYFYDLVVSIGAELYQDRLGQTHGEYSDVRDRIGCDHRGTAHACRAARIAAPPRRGTRPARSFRAHVTDAGSRRGEPRASR